MLLHETTRDEKEASYHLKTIRKQTNNKHKNGKTGKDILKKSEQIHTRCEVVKINNSLHQEFKSYRVLFNTAPSN